MKSILIIAIAILSFSTYGQDVVKQKNTSEFKRLLIGINISPDYCNRILKINQPSSAINKFIFNSRQNIEIAKFGYSFGFHMRYNKTRHLSFEGGIQYANKGYATKKMDLIFGDLIDNRYGFVYSSNQVVAVSLNFIYTYVYLDVPLRVIYAFGNQRFNYLMSVGCTPNVLMKTTTSSLFGDTKRTTTESGYNVFNFSPTISVGANYRISNKLDLRVEPTVRYGMIPVLNADIKEYLWTAGLNFSFDYTLK